MLEHFRHSRVFASETTGRSSLQPESARSFSAAAVLPAASGLCGETPALSDRGGDPSGHHPREFQLLTASARWPLLPGDAEEIARLASAALDWKIFLEMTALHRLAPLVYHNLKDCAAVAVPGAAMAELRELARSSAAGIFPSIAEMLRVTGALAGRQIESCVLKGVPLAVEAYGDPGLRHLGDIDLLIRRADLEAADDVVQGLGYRIVEPKGKLTPRRRAYYTAHWKDFVYEHPATGHSVELHWRLTRNAAMPGAELASSRGALALGAARVATLAPDDLVLYLCIHGALDAWMRLKALADIVALFRPMDARRFESIRRRAEALGVLPELSAAILLAASLFRVDLPGSGLLSEKHPVVRHILTFSRRAITGNDYRLPREEIGGAAWVRYELGLCSSWRYRWEVMQRALFRPRVWEFVDLPDRLFPFYAVLSPLEWLVYHLRRRPPEA